jgi:serine/threonine protein kinase
VLLLAIQIADALISAHHLGILHGDLKPSNILLTPDARPILLDFNLSQDFVHSPGICGGTLPYMPPEYLYVVAQRSEKPSDSHFSPAPDIYSFGALLYELLAGVPPVTFSEGTGDTCAVADQMLTSLERGINGIRAYNPLVSGELESVILQCLELNPDQRYASLAELTTRLRNHLRPFARFRRVARMKSRSLACKCRNSFSLRLQSQLASSTLEYSELRG